MYIVNKGVAKATIVIPAHASLREEFAATELQKYITEISGVGLNIITDDENISGNMLIIGGPERNKKAAECICTTEFDMLIPGPEGMMIKIFEEDKLLLAGSSKNPYEYERATLYAVYTFLENYLGCSFAAYAHPQSSIGEWIPRMNSICIENISYLKSKSDLWYRTAIVQYYNTKISPTHALNFKFIDWLAKNKYNRILTMASIYEEYKKNGMLEEAQRRGILFTAGHHESSMLFLPPDGNEYFSEHYYQTHPEYYKLLPDGTRYYSATKWEGQWIFCSRNENAIQQIAENIIKWIDKNPYVDVVTLWPNDHKDEQCCCPICSQYSKGENYTYFVNEVAKKVSFVHKNIKIDMIAYIDLWQYPSNMKLSASLLVDCSTWHDTGLRYIGKRDGSSLIGTLYEEEPNKWHEAGATVVYYDYYMGNFDAHQRCMPMADELQSIYRHFQQTGYCQGTGTQLEPFNLWNNLFNFYVHGRTGYDLSLSLENHLTFFTRIFGKGASFIKEYLIYAEEVLEGQERIHRAGIYFIQNVDKKKVYQLFDAAYNAAGEGQERNAIRMLRMAFRYSDLEINNTDPSELKYMKKHFDSFTNPGFGIFIDSDGFEDNFQPNEWYFMV